MGPAFSGERGDGTDRCDGGRIPAGGSGAGFAGQLDAVYRPDGLCLDQQYGAGDGAEHLRRDVRSRSGDAGGGGDETASTVSDVARLWSRQSNQTAAPASSALRRMARPQKKIRRSTSVK